MKILDFALLAISLVLTGTSAWFVFSSANTVAQIEIQTDEGKFLYPLEKDQEIAVKGPLGITHVDVQGKKVWVHDSPCTNKVCIQMGAISHSGQWVACLPNHVFVKVIGRTDSGEGIDAQLY